MFLCQSNQDCCLRFINESVKGAYTRPKNFLRIFSHPHQVCIYLYMQYAYLHSLFKPSVMTSCCNTIKMRKRSEEIPNLPTSYINYIAPLLVSKKRWKIDSFWKPSSWSNDFNQTASFVASVKAIYILGFSFYDTLFLTHTSKWVMLPREKYITWWLNQHYLFNSLSIFCALIIYKSIAWLAECAIQRQLILLAKK